MFTTGQLVVCVDDNFDETAKRIYTALPVKDGIYTVRDVMPGVWFKGKQKSYEIAVTLVELINPVSAKGHEFAFNAERFAPLLPPQETEAEEPLEAVA